tara:strand:- start:7416 stop:8774 length:1359 start_codon:yes stop_codon:yes gene_type:complete
MKICCKLWFILLAFFSCTNEEKSNIIFDKYNPRPVSYTRTLDKVINQPVDFVEAAEKSINAVVHVKNTSIISDDFSYLDYFYGRNKSRQNRIGTGSGVIVSPDGLIITNNHVIEDATKIEVTTNDNIRYEAELIGTDPYTDIAVLKIQTQKLLPYLYFANSDNTKIGEWVLAIGNPFNLNSTVTAGIISAKSRDLNKLDRRNQSFIQTDAAVNQGNSGGALVNLDGELIGINTAITTISGGFEGYSFAVPSNIAKKVFEDIIEFGTNQKGMLGVQGFAISPEFEKFIQENKIKQSEGFYVSKVLENMGASNAGIKEGDILISVDNIKIKKFSDLTGYLESKRPGDNVKIGFFRKDVKKYSMVRLEKTKTVQFLNMTLSNLTKKERENLKIKNGLRIVDSGEFLKGQIENNSILIDINGDLIDTVDEILQMEPESVEWLTYINPNGEKIRLRF